MPRGRAPTWTEDPLARNARQARVDDFRDAISPESFGFTGDADLDARTYEREKAAAIEREEDIAFRHARRLSRRGGFPPGEEPALISLATHDPLSQRFNFERLFTVPQGEELPSDGPGNDRVDSALEARTRSYQQADDLNWLLEATEGRTAAASRPSYSPPYRPMDDGENRLAGLAKAAALDVGIGTVESPRQVVGGMRDAVQSILDLTELGGDWLEEQLPIGGVSIGQDGIGLVSAEEFAEQREGGETGVDFPQVQEPTTVTGGAIRAITQFIRR